MNRQHLFGVLLCFVGLALWLSDMRALGAAVWVTSMFIQFSAINWKLARRGFQLNHRWRKLEPHQRALILVALDICSQHSQGDIQAEYAKLRNHLAPDIPAPTIGGKP